MSLYRAYLQVQVEAEGIGDAYNRIEILIMHWPKRRWRYADPALDDFANLETGEPHYAPDNDP